MALVSIMILTKDRAELLKGALRSIQAQTFSDYEVVIVDDGSSDHTPCVLKEWRTAGVPFRCIRHETCLGITRSRQEALLACRGRYVALLDDDDEWTDAAKLHKQIEYLEANPKLVLTGGGRLDLTRRGMLGVTRLRPQRDSDIRRTMLLRNNVFCSTVVFSRAAALEAGGFSWDGDDIAEDYDLWLRLGRLGCMHNHGEALAKYRLPTYRLDRFLLKQLRLIRAHADYYPHARLAEAVLRTRLTFCIRLKLQPTAA